jgi:hypothetical protein
MQSVLSIVIISKVIISKVILNIVIDSFTDNAHIKS